MTAEPATPAVRESAGTGASAPRHHELVPIKGPSALGGDPRRFLELTWTLAVLEFRLKFFGSVLGHAWQLMRPLLLFGVLYVVFTEFVRLGGGVTHYPAVLLMAIVIYQFYAEATGASVGSVLNRENLVRKIHFPRMVIPLSVVLTTYLNFVLNFIAVIVFVLVQGVELRWTWLEIIPLLLILGLFCTGIGMALSALFVRYRDVQPIWDVVLPMSFYGSPVIYPIETVSNETIRHLLMCNPLAAIIQQTRHALIDPTAMTAAQAIGGGWRLLIPGGIVVGVFILGFWIFNRSAPQIAEEL
jgi:ABC-2 type transport system permease protein